VLAGVVNFDHMAKLLFQGVADHAGPLQPLIMPLGVLGLEWLLLWFLYRHKVFFRL
jgi:hypothetical protein